jgi:RHS repeat-associated protein
MLLRNWKPALILSLLFFFVSPGHALAASPTITSLSPTTGAVGATVTITGTNFGSPQGTSTVKFNGTTAATATNWSTTSITVTVPSGATTGSVVVTVSGVASNGKTFTVVSAPSITSLSITTGAVGAAVTITGTSFGSTQGSGTVSFNGTGATVTSWNATTIKVTVPTGATTGNVVVFASGVNSNGSSFTVVAAPSITSLSVTTGAVGAAVTITGTNFGTTQGSGTASFNGKAATVSSWSATSIAVTVPSGATTGNVVVFASGVNSNGINFTVAPSITSLSTSTGAVGVAVTITGKTFGSTQGSGTVSFNGTLAEVTSWSATSIGVTVPGDATTGYVVVFAGGVNSNGDSFTVAPAISNLSPTTGAVGAAVTITGTTFGSSQGSSTVKFNGHTATVTSWSVTSIGTTVPSGATTGNVVVNTGVNSNGFPFTVVSAPAITGLSISSGVTGNPVTITGTNFGSSGTVTFNGTVASVTSWAATSIGVTVPSGSTTGNVVVFASGVNSNGWSFTVLNPTITSLSVNTGAVGTAVTVTGMNFGSTQGNSSVTFNGTVANNITNWSTTSISATVPNGAATGNIVVNASGLNSNGVVFTVISTLPIGWSDADVGAVGLAGTAGFANGTFTLQGSGYLVNTADELHFAYQALSGDGTIIVRVVTAQAGYIPYAGVMIRETLDSAATSAFVGYWNLSISYIDRPTTGANASSQSNDAQAPLPYWVKLVRSGNTFSAYEAPDGVNWLQVGSSETITMAQDVYIGLAVSNYSNSSLATATFDNVSINTAAAPAPVITSLSATTGPVGTQVIISGSGFGASQGSSVVTLSAAPVTINAWSATSITITIPSGATSGPVLVSVAPSMNDSNYVDFTVTTQPLPTGWLDQDVGVVGTPGTATYSNGTFTVAGSGEYIGGSADEMHFVYQPLSGDGTIVAQVITATGANSPQGGVMIRETLNADAINAFVAYQGSGISFSDRANTGANASSQTNGTTLSLPYWVMLVRSGSTFSGYQSSDGVNWVPVGTPQSITMAENAYVGLAVCGYSSSGAGLATATFRNVSVSSDSNSGPIISSLSTSTGPIGTQVFIYGSGFGATQGNSVVTLNGTPVTINSWIDTSISVTIPSGATSGLFTVSVAPTMNASNGVPFTLTLQPLPTGWLDQDVGSVGSAGSATYASGVFTITGSGTGIFNTADGMHFAYLPLSGNGSIIARVVSEQSTYNSQPGVMIRESLEANSANAFAGPAGSNQDAYVEFYDRPTPGAETNQQSASQAVVLPYWVKLTRSGTTFSAYEAPDGINWTQVATSQTITMSQNVFVGLAVSDEDNNGTATATFDNVSYTFGAASATPVVYSVTPGSGGLGSQVTIAGSNFGTSQGSSSITFNGTAASSITSWTNSQIVAIVPTTATSGSVVVVVNSVASNADMTFTVINPVVSAVMPASAPVGGTVTVTGTGFGALQNGSQVQFNGLGGNVTSWSATSVTLTVPSGATSGPLLVAEDGVTSNTIQFTVTEALSVTALNPNVGPVGSSVTITGTGFSASPSNSTVTFNGILTTTTGWSDTQITAIVPAGTTTGPVSVDVAGITALGPNFQINNTVTLTDSLSNNSTYTTAIVGGKWYVIKSTGSGCSSCTLRGLISKTFDNYGNVLTVTDELGNVTSYTYDSNQNMLSKSVQANSGLATTSYTYNSFGEPLTITDPLGNTTTNTYDAHGNLLTVIAPAPNGNTAASVTQFAYNSLGELTQITDPLGRPTKLTYTSAGLISTITDPQQNVTTYQYDTFGNRTSIKDAMNNTTTFAYDSGNRLLTITYPGSTTMSFTYDYRGRRITMTDQNNKTTTYAYDGADRLTSVKDPDTNVTYYNYDTENNLLSIEDANTHTTSFTYDAFGRVTKTTFPSNYFETYAYDAANNLTSKMDRKGQTINYVYDDLYRLTQKTYPDSTSVEYVYDLVGKLLSVTDPTGTYGFAYDNMGRLVGATTQYAFLSGNYTTSYTYDANSNRLTMTDPQSGVTNYVYDTLNRLSTLTPPTAFSSTGFGFTYDALSRRTQMTRPNGVTTNYSYDSLSRLLSVLHQVSTNTIDGAAYTYDSAGNRLTTTNELAVLTSNYTYDPLYELTQVTQATNTTESYSYDSVGNRLSSQGLSPYTNNASNELTSTPSASYAYDYNGNLTSKTVSGSTTQYNWDYENRLISAVLPGTGGTVTFKYDGVGHRVQKAFTQNSTTTTINYLYDGANAIEDVDQNGNVLARYEQTTNIDELLAELRSGTTSYYEADALGSVTSLTSSAGALANTYTYDSFGNLIASTGSLTNRFQFTGREFDAETGIDYYRARYYDPTAGRFVNEDPLRYLAGGNFYRYVYNNPLAYIDRSGMQDESPEGGANPSPGPVPGGPYDPGGPGPQPLPGPRPIPFPPILPGRSPNWGNPGPPSPPLAPLPPPGWASKTGPLGPVPSPDCGSGKVRCWLSGEFKDPSIDSKLKMCSYSCSDGTARVYLTHIFLPCPPTPDRLPQ